jgi:hypothetical protein
MTLVKTGVLRSFSQEQMKKLQKLIQVGIIKIIWGVGSYLIEDSGGPEGLKDYLAQYARQQRDGDRWETQEDFAIRIQPAMQSFKAHKHAQYL